MTDELPMDDSPGDLLAVGPAARVIGRQGSRRMILLQPALLGETMVVPVVIELGADDKPIPEQDKRNLAVRPFLTALEDEPIPLHPEGWIGGGSYRALTCVAHFGVTGHAHAALRLDVTTPLFDEPVSFVFALGQP